MLEQTYKQSEDGGVKSVPCCVADTIPGAGVRKGDSLCSQSLHSNVRTQTLSKHIKEQRLPDAETCL